MKGEIVQMITISGAGMQMAERKRLRGERTRTGKDKPIGAGAGRYLWTLREMQGYSRESVEQAVGEMLGKSTPIGHATLIGIERGARMPSVDIIGGIMEYLKGDWSELFDLIKRDASEEEGRKMAHKRMLINAVGGITPTGQEMINQLTEEEMTRVLGIFSNDALRAVVDRMIDNPEAVRIIKAVLDARNE